MDGSSQKRSPASGDDQLEVGLDEYFLQSLSDEIDALKEDARKILLRRLRLIQRRRALLDGQLKAPCS